MRALRAFIAARQAKQAVEHLLDELGWPNDPVLSRTLDHLQLLIEQSTDTMAKINAARRRSA